jgi:hypothetical protein
VWIIQDRWVVRWGCDPSEGKDTVQQLAVRNTAVPAGKRTVIMLLFPNKFVLQIADILCVLTCLCPGSKEVLTTKADKARNEKGRDNHKGRHVQHPTLFACVPHSESSV